MDPQQRTALIEQARAAGLFDTDFMPEEDLDTIELVETAAGDLLVLTQVEAAHYGDAMVKARTNSGGAPVLNAVEAIFGERTMVTLERLGRLRARAIEDLGEQTTIGDLRERILAEVEEELRGIEPTGVAVRRREAATIAALARAWRDLGGQPEPTLLPAVPMTATMTSATVTSGLNDLEARRLAGHVYQCVNVADGLGGIDQAAAAEVARAAVIEGLEELRAEAGR